MPNDLIQKENIIHIITWKISIIQRSDEIKITN